MAEKRLTPKESLFVKHYLRNNFNGYQAAVSAGYSEKDATSIASQNLRKPHIKAAIDAEMKSINKKIELTFEYKLQKLKKCIELSLIENADGTYALTNSKALLGAIAEANKMQGHYSAEKVVTANVNADADINQIDELIRKYQRDY